MSGVNGEKRTVLITGCTKNSIGDFLAQEFFRRGLHVIATARSLDRVRHLQEMGMRTLELDITSSASIQKLRQQIDQLDILVNNAGFVVVAPLMETSVEDFKRLFETNTFGAFELTQALLPLLVESKGIILNHTSQSPYGVGITNGAYAASKAALANFTSILRIELAPFGIRVVELITGVAASNITTDFQPSYLKPDSMYDLIRPEMEKAMSGADVKGKEMRGDVYARKVVGDLLGSRGPPVWIWRGTFASTMYCVWLVGCLWKGLLDGLLSRTVGLHLLAGRLKEASQKKHQ